MASVVYVFYDCTEIADEHRSIPLGPLARLRTISMRMLRVFLSPQSSSPCVNGRISRDPQGKRHPIILCVAISLDNTAGWNDPPLS